MTKLFYSNCTESGLVSTAEGLLERSNGLLKYLKKSLLWMSNTGHLGIRFCWNTSAKFWKCFSEGPFGNLFNLVASIIYWFGFLAHHHVKFLCLRSSAKETFFFLFKNHLLFSNEYFLEFLNLYDLLAKILLKNPENLSPKFIWQIFRKLLAKYLK